MLPKALDNVSNVCSKQREDVLILLLNCTSTFEAVCLVLVDNDERHVYHVLN